MSRRLLIVEPDASGRTMMDRVLTSDGFAADTTGSALEAGALLDAGQIEVVVIDELAGDRPVLEQVRWLRRKYPSIPVIVTGALLSRRSMQELVRMRVADVLAKPFTPTELREAVGRAIERKLARHDAALEYDAALNDARRALAAGSFSEARAPLSRAQATSPFDSEIMALLALLAELEGKDDDADRGYRAALALRNDEACPAPDPHEGLARLAAYEGARPVGELGAARAGQPFVVMSDPAVELRAAERSLVPGPHVVVMALGLGAAGPETSFCREGDGGRAFVLLAGGLRAEPLAELLVKHRAGPLLAPESTVARLDLARVDALRVVPRAKALRDQPAAS